MSTPNDNSNISAAAAAPKKRDEQKLEKEGQAVINDLIDKTQRFLSLLLKGPPDLWNRPAFDDIRSSINTIVANPEKYPLSPGGWGESMDCLTKEVANRLKSRSMEAERECGTDKNAIYLQISSSTCMTKPNTIGINGSTTDITRQVWKFNALDGDNNPLIFRTSPCTSIMTTKMIPGAQLLLAH
jgi:hypothetical protein